MTTPRLLTYNAAVVAREMISDSLSIFRIALDPESGEIPDFIPGQYLVLGANNERDPTKGSVRRSYSICSQPEEKRYFEFFVRASKHHYTDNPMTEQLWRMQVGSRLWVGPKITGNFTIDHTVGRNDPRLKILVGSGTGIGPFVSLVRHAAAARDPSRIARLRVLYGARYPEELAYQTELLALNDAGQTRYLASVSRSPERPDWPGFTGRIETLFDRPDIDTLLGLDTGDFDPGHTVIYICGQQGTISETIRRLLPKGFVPHDRRLKRVLGIAEEEPSSLFFEQYDATPIFDIQNQQIVQELKALRQRA